MKFSQSTKPKPDSISARELLLWEVPFVIEEQSGSGSMVASGKAEFVHALLLNASQLPELIL
jgi:hypothetical protein